MTDTHDYIGRSVDSSLYGYGGEKNISIYFMDIGVDDHSETYLETIYRGLHESYSRTFLLDNYKMEFVKLGLNFIAFETSSW